MNRKILIALSASAVVLGACGHKTETTTTDTTVTNSTVSTDNTAAATAPALSASQTFVNTAAASDAFEIATSKLALDTSKSAAVKKFADAMIKAHTGSTDKLKGITAALTPPLTPDPTLSADQQSTLDDLKSKTGSDFDSAYAAAQVAAHQAALSGLKDYGANGDVPQLKVFATGLVPTVTAHLNMANALK